MQIYEELVRRGLIAQVTDEQEIHDLINNGNLTISLNSSGGDVKLVNTGTTAAA